MFVGSMAAGKLRGFNMPCKCLRVAVFSIGLLVLSSTAVLADMYAGNADPKTLHTVEDYLAFVPETELPAAERTKLLAGAAVNAAHDAVFDNSGNYYLSYDFLTAGLAMEAHLEIFADKSKALVYAEQMLAGTRAGLAESGASLAPIAGLEDWYPGSKFFVTSRGADPVGNNFILIKDGNVYEVMLAGAGYFGDAATVREFLGAKVDKVLNFSPQFAPGRREAAATDLDRRGKERETRKDTFAGALALINIICYLAAASLALLINKFTRTRRLNTRWMGFAGVLAFTAFYFGITWYALRNEANAALLAEQQRTELYGQPIASALVALLLIWAVQAMIRRLYGPPRTEPV